MAITLNSVFFDRDSPYYVTIEAFNEGGKSKKSTPFKID